MCMFILYLYLYFQFHRSLLATKATGYRTCHNLHALFLGTETSSLTATFTKGAIIIHFNNLTNMYNSSVRY
jgi:hypothetical protein